LEKFGKQCAQPTHVGSALFHSCNSTAGCFCKPNDERNCFTPTATATLLPATVQERFQLHTASNIERTDSFWSVDFVSRHRGKVYPKLSDVERYFAKTLDCIRVDECIGETLPQLGDRLESAGFIIAVHDAYQHIRAVERAGFTCIKLKDTIPPDRKQAKLDASFCQCLGRMEHCVVLDR
jgi:hypothetical protein